MPLQPKPASDVEWTTALRDLRDPEPRRVAGEEARARRPLWRRIVFGGVTGLALTGAAAAAVVLPDPMRARLAAGVVGACTAGPGLFLPPFAQDPLDQLARLEENETRIDSCAEAQRALALHDAGICSELVHDGPTAALPPLAARP